MKKWERYSMTGVFLVIIGAILIAWAMQAAEPIKTTVHVHKNIFGEDVYDDVDVSFDAFFLYPLILGLLSIGLGVGEIGAVYDFYKLEKH